MNTTIHPKADPTLIEQIARETVTDPLSAVQRVRLRKLAQFYGLKTLKLTDDDLVRMWRGGVEDERIQPEPDRPAEPAPVEPAPVTPEPAPARPAPVEPAPAPSSPAPASDDAATLAAAFERILASNKGVTEDDIRRQVVAALNSHLADAQSTLSDALAQAMERVEEMIADARLPRIAVVESVEPKPTREVTGFVHEKFTSIMRAVRIAKRCGMGWPYLVGPAGGGKSHTGRQVAEALEVDYYETGAVLEEYKLFGFQDATGRYHRTAFREAWEKGGVFIFDEIDGSDPQVLVSFNAALANGHCTFPDSEHGVPRHPDFVAIACANTIGRGATAKYVGRNGLDLATLDRFAFIPFDYDEAVENQITANKEFTAKVRKLRAAAEKLELDILVTPRASRLGGEWIADGGTAEEALQLYVFKGLDPDTLTTLRSEAGV